MMWHLKQAWTMARAILAGYKVVVVTRGFIAVHRAVSRREALEWFRCYGGQFSESVTMYRYGSFIARRMVVR